MIKEYFSHDYNARNDRKLVKLRMGLGLEGVGIYWCIIEMLYENGGKVNLSEIERISFELGVPCERITDVLRNYELFRFKGEVFHSVSVSERLEKRKAKSDKARDSAVSRWNRAKEGDANALRTHCDGNANKSKDKGIVKEEIYKEESWRDSFDLYMKECKTAYNDLYKNKEFITEQSRLNPNVDIKLSIEKGYVNFWGTEAGWKHKKKSRSKTIDWKLTIVNSISMNKVYNDRSIQKVSR